MVKVFINYSSRDFPLVVSLYQGLANKPDLEVYFDAGRISPGENWIDRRDTELDSSDVVLVAIGPDWSLSASIEYEIDLSLKTNKRIFPILLGENTFFPQLSTPIQSLGNFIAARYRLSSFQSDIDNITRIITRIGGARDILHTAGFSESFINMFNRLSNPNLGKASDMMMFHSGIDWDETQIPEFIDLLNQLMTTLPDFPSTSSNQAKLIHLREFTRPGSIDAFVESIVKDPIGAQIIAGLAINLITATAFYLGSRYRLAIQVSPFIRGYIQDNLAPETIILPDDSGVVETGGSLTFERMSYNDNPNNSVRETFLTKFVDNQSIAGFRIGNIARFGTEYIEENF